MHRILVIDDEEAIRKNLDRLLSLEGYEVATASDGQHGLAVACSMRPAIIITDINMPQMDGFALLDAVRSHPELERTAVIMLTAAEDRSHVRKGMARGADDYITKPFKREELLEAIAAQLAKITRFERHKNQAVSQAQLQQQNEAVAPAPAAAVASALAGSLHDGPPARRVQATVLFANINNFSALAQQFSEDELSQLLSRYFAQICQPVVAYGGTHLKMSGDSLLALFEDDRYGAADGTDSVHASRALSAALALYTAAQEFRAMVARRYGARAVPELHVGIGLHSGEVSLAQQGQHGVSPLGHTVDTATHLQALGKMHGWAIAASATTVLLAGSGVQQGREHAMGMQEPTSLPLACEVLGYHTPLDLKQGLDHEAMAFENAVLELTAQENAHTTARSAKAALLQSVV